MLLVHGPPIAQPLVVLVVSEPSLFRGSDISQTIPLTVTVAPPFESTVPDPVAEEVVILETEPVVTEGTVIIGQDASEGVVAEQVPSH